MAGQNELTKILNDSWNHYKKFKIEPATSRPLGDQDKSDIANGSLNKYLTFSETVSYVLFRSVLIGDKDTFDKTWLWAKNNLQRKNITGVFHWYEKKWVPVPAEKKDHLFAWRYTPNINNSGHDGVIYYYWTPETDKKTWRDGLDVAPDGDQLIAGSLILADLRWKDDPLNYKQEAKAIINDLWNKTVNKIIPGEITCSEKSAPEWFKYISAQGHMFLAGTENSIRIEVNDSSYSGIGKLISECDLSNGGPIHVLIKGNGFFKIILEDNQKRKISSLNNPLKSADQYAEYIINFPGQSEQCDLSKIRIIMLEFSNGYYDLAKIVLGNQANPENIGRYHLLSNDKNMPWINPSYYMPFLYRIFAKLDLEHPWEQLAADAYKDIQESMQAKLSNDKSERFAGKGILMPNWLTYNELGQITDLPWAQDEVIDDYMSGWDAFRSWYFMAADKRWHNASEPDYFLNGKSYEFFKNQLEQYGYIRAGYTIAGEIKNANWVDQNSFGINGAYLAFFSQTNDKANTEKILDSILKKYDPKGYWEDRLEYFKQNWAWLGLAFYSGLGDELFSQLNKKKYI